MNALLIHLALVFCPSDFRHGFRERFDHNDAPESGVSLAIDLAATGITLRWEMICRDVFRASRALVTAPLFSIVAILAIALSVGANVIVASILGALVLQPLPFPEPQQLLFVQETEYGNTLTYPDARALAERMHQIGTLALSAFDNRTLSGRGHAVELFGGKISSNYFDILGVRPELGRFLSTSSAKDAIIISHNLWHSRFASNPNVLGDVVRLNSHDYHVIGVAPTGFKDPTVYGLFPRQYWLPIDTRDPREVGPGQFNYMGIARIRSGLDADRASHDIVRDLSELSSIVKGRSTNLPGFYNLRTRTVQDVIIGPVRALLWALYAAASLVLLIACTNVANLHFSRHVAREGRLALISALGATGRRITIELASEAALLAIAGGAAGLGIAWFGLGVLGSSFASIAERWDTVHLEGTTVLYAAALVPLITIIAGLTPALLQRRNLVASLRSSSQSGQWRFADRLRSSLVIAQVALAMTLAICAGLVLRSFLTLTNVDLGFDPKNVYVVQGAYGFTGTRYVTNTARLAWAYATSKALGAIPGVTSISMSAQVPFLCCDSVSVRIPGHARQISINDDVVTPEYFHTLRIPVLRGRLFTEADRIGSPYVAIIDETFAQTYFGTLDVIGRKITPSVKDRNPAATIVGVVGNVRQGFGIPPQPIFYLPMAQDPQFFNFLVRTDYQIVNTTAAVDAVFDRIDPTLPIPLVRPLAANIDESRRASQTSLLLFSILAGIALALCLTGVYAVSAYSVEQRRREFGIRKALGATTGNVLRNVLFRALQTSAVGIGIGIILTAVSSRYLGDLLYQTSPWDPMTFIAAVILFPLCVIGSALVPALRAMRVEPAVALRSE